MLRVVATMAPVALACALLGASPALAHCGAAGERACCTANVEFAVGGGPCNTGLWTIPGCSGSCDCHDDPNNIFDSSAHCVTPTSCGGDGQRGCCVGEANSACQAGMTEVNGCDLGADQCGCSNSHCRQATHCGGPGERACCVTERVNGCDSGTVLFSPCTGDCFCGGAANPLNLNSSGYCHQVTHCGGDGERACCAGTFEYATGTTAGICENGKTAVFACDGDCQCGAAAAEGVKSLQTCIVVTPCGGENERACTVLERLPSCDSGLTEIPGCTGDCFGRDAVSSGTCIRLDSQGKLPLISQPGTNRVAPPTAARTCALRGYADIHLHMFSDNAHGGGVFGGAAWDPVADDVNVALRPDYGTHRNLVKNNGDPLPTPSCPTWIRDCGTKLFHGDHVALSDDPVGFGTGDQPETNLGAPNFTGWPTWHTTTHQQSYYKWLERAYQGGLRLISMLAVTNEALCRGNKHYENIDCADSMTPINEQLADAVAFETFIDNQSGGSGQGWFRIVRTPAEARQAITDGKLAVVLGIEVDNLFNCHWANRNDTAGPCSPAGIVERVNHYYDLGVRHVFPIHNFNNAFGGPATWQDAIDVGNRASEGHWWSPTSETDATPGIIDCHDNGYRFKLSCVMNAVVQLLGFPPNVIPWTDPIPCFSTAGATCNPIGLTTRGRDLVNAFMNKGMIVDIDHMSVEAIDDTLALARQRTPEYPLVASHVQFFDLNQESRRHERMRTRAQLQAIKNGGGMIAAMLKDDGQDSALGKGSRSNIPYTTSPTGFYIPDNCRHSTETFAQAYQYAVDVMGRPVALGSDFNGVAGHIGPRFGSDGCGNITPEWIPEYRFGNRLVYPFDFASFGEPGFGSFGKQVTGGKTFNFNVDGLAHIGLLPDMVADLHQVGLPGSYFDKLFDSAEEFIRVWERGASIAAGTGGVTGAPDARCQDRTVNADASCQGTASIAADDIDPTLTLSQSPAGPYGPGPTQVTLTASSSQSCLNDTCNATVTVADTTGPTVTCPQSVTQECAGSSTPVSYGAPQSTDNCGTPTSDGCAPASGTGFSFGNTTVTCRAHDVALNPSDCSMTVSVVDTTNPTIQCSASQHLECTSPAGASATFGASASDTCFTTIQATCNPPSGSTLPIGSSSVHCGAIDQAGNTAACSIPIDVRDTVPPSINCPAPATLECTGNRTAANRVIASALDLCTASPLATCSPNDVFPLGTNPVTCTATDGAGLQAQCGTSVTVRDTTPPSIVCPAPRTLECTGSNSARATVTATGSDVCWGQQTPVCSPAGTNYLYPLGTTAIGCSETDGSGLSAQCPTSVRVVDTARPTVTSAVAVDVLNIPTGPNHDLLNVGLTASATDTCSGALAVSVRVYANEDDETPTGDGTFSPDARSIAPGTLRLRYERIGSKDGRVYLIVVKATDTSGNVGASCSTVAVPKSQNTPSINAIRATAASVRSACIAGNGSVPAGYFVVGDGAVIGSKQ